jgi:hypothetical protein
LYILKLFIKHPIIDINICNNSGENILEMSILNHVNYSFSKKNVVYYILKYTNIHRFYVIETILKYFMYYDYNILKMIIQYMNKKYIDINISNSVNENLLTLYFEKINAVKLLLRYNINTHINQTCDNNRTHDKIYKTHNLSYSSKSISRMNLQKTIKYRSLLKYDKRFVAFKRDSNLTI